MDHDHGHGHGGHSHGVSTHTDLRWLSLALVINAAFMLVEVAAGAIAHSLALLSDAAHMLTDAGAIGLALFAAWLARRQPKGAMTYGLGRAEILSAQANGLTLLILAAFIIYEGVRRLVSPPHVEALLMLTVGLAGFAVNLAAALALARANRKSLNVEGAFQHNLIDAYASVGTALAASVILLSGFDRADPIASLLIAAVMLRSGYKLVKASGRIFLEAAPEGLDPNAIGYAMAAQQGVSEVHDLHVWEVTSGFPALSAHVIVPPDADCHAKRRELEGLLHERFGIEHSTLQVEHETQLRNTAPQPSTNWPGFAPNPRQFKCGSCGFRRLTAVSRHRAPAAANPQNPAQRCGKRLRKAKNPRTSASCGSLTVWFSRPEHFRTVEPDSRCSRHNSRQSRENTT